MERRTFIEYTSMLSAMTAMGYMSCNESSKYKLGYQLFSVNQDMNTDPIATLKALIKMGYEDFEIYGFDPAKVTYYGYPAKELKGIMDDMGITATSGHYGFSEHLQSGEDAMKRFTEQCIQGALALNTPYITWPWLDPTLRNMDGFKMMVPMLNKIGEWCKDAGVGFAYHNHGFEFEDRNGTNGYELILTETDPNLVKLQMDMYWVMHSSDTTPKELVERQPGRYVMWHIKDMDKVTRDYTELGNGSIDYTQILPDPVKSGLQYSYIEQGGNFTVDAITSAETSAKYYKKHLSKML